MVSKTALGQFMGGLFILGQFMSIPCSLIIFSPILFWETAMLKAINKALFEKSKDELSSDEQSVDELF